MSNRIIIVFILFISSLSYTSSFAQSQKAYIKKGNESFETKDYSSAYYYYQKALEFNDNEPELNYKVAKCYKHLNNYYLAERHFTKTIEQDASNQFQDAYYHLAVMQKYSGKYEDAIHNLETYIKTQGDSSNNIYNKVQLELESCKWAQNQIYPNGLKVHKLKGKINTEHTEFAPFYINDSIIYYSSLSFEGEKLPENAPTPYISKILRSMDGSRGWRTGRPLKTTFNRKNSHNCNATLSADGKLMMFTRCNYNEENYLECKLYESSLVNGKWQAPKRVDSRINKRGYTATQPGIANAGAEGYIVYFVSNRPGGLGGLDIWYSKRNAMGAYNEPVNAGPVINTINDEITPYYHNPTQALYFSSNGHKGFGGYDIFKSTSTNFTYYDVDNIGHLINSTFNDQYAVLNSDASKVLFSSNRPENNMLRNETCCYDLFMYDYRDVEEEESDTTVVAIIDTTSSENEFEDLTNFKPIHLYFHNDEPDNNSWSTSTEQTYLQTYYGYLELQDEYREKFSVNNSDYSKEEAQLRITNFFINEVKGGFGRLQNFSNKLLSELQNGINVKVMVRGHTSPLAASDYNMNLAKRRISSLQNHLKSYKNGVFLPFINSKQLVVEEEPAGELFVLPGVSDELEDVTNSVYSPEAARERRIEITRVIIRE